jgi:hypothetical protein
MSVEEKFFLDVKTLVSNGQSFMHENHPQYDGFKRFGRYLKRNAPKIASNAIKTVVAGVLTGGVAAAVGITVTVGKSVIIYVYRRIKKDSMKKTIAAHAGGTTQTSSSLASAADIAAGKASGKTIQTVDESYSGILDEMSYLIQHGELTKLMNAFAELDADAKALETFTRSSSYSKCEDGWQIAEYVERIDMRIKGLEEAIDLIQDYVEYSVLLTSKYDEGFKQRRRQIVRWIISKAGNRDAAVQILNQAANSRGVFNSKFFNSNHTKWALAATELDTVYKDFQFTSGDVGEVLLDATMDYAAALPLSVAVEAAKDSAFSFDEMFTGNSEGLLGAASSGAADGISSGIGIGVDLAVGVIDKYMSSRAYRSVKDLVKVRVDSNKKMVEVLSEFDAKDVIVLRRAAKDVLEKCTTKLKHLGEAQLVADGLNQQMTPQKLAEGLLRRQKLRQQFAQLSQALYLLQEITVGRAIAIQIAAGNIRATEYPKIGQFIATGHKDDEVCEGLCCYTSSAKMFDKTNEIFDLNINPALKGVWKANWANIPFRPVTKNGLFNRVWEPNLP